MDYIVHLVVFIIIIIIIIIITLRAFNTSIKWWFSPNVWVTSFSGSPGLF